MKNFLDKDKNYEVPVSSDETQFSSSPNCTKSHPPLLF